MRRNLRPLTGSEVCWTAFTTVVSTKESQSTQITRHSKPCIDMAFKIYHEGPHDIKVKLNDAVKSPNIIKVEGVGLRIGKGEPKTCIALIADNAGYH